MAVRVVALMVVQDLALDQTVLQTQVVAVVVAAQLQQQVVPAALVS
jgi:hypothetical protein